MLMIQRDINKQDHKIVDLHFVKSEYHQLKVMNRVSEAQLQVCKNFNQKT